MFRLFTVSTLSYFHWMEKKQEGKEVRKFNEKMVKVDAEQLYKVSCRMHELVQKLDNKTSILRIPSVKGTDEGDLQAFIRDCYRKFDVREDFSNWEDKIIDCLVQVKPD